MIIDIVGPNFSQREAYKEWKSYWKNNEGEVGVILRRVEHEKDPNCIEIRTKDTNLLIGYVRREISNVLAKRLDNGKLEIVTSTAISRFQVRLDYVRK